MRSSANRILGIGIILGLSVCLLNAGRATAGSPSFTLWTDGVNGWSSTNASFTNPGPHMTVYVGDNVTLVLNATDGANHQWFIDYNNDSRRQANEPQSPQFRNVAVSWNFTANVNGTYNYRDRPNPALAGPITILTGSPPGALDTGLLIAIGAVIAFVAVVAVLWFVMQKKPAKKSEKE